MDIKDILRRRTDLSTFLVHLTRDADGVTARDRLESILKNGRIDAHSMFGQAVNSLKAKGLVFDSQKCVCFTETPIEHLYLLLEQIEGRQIQFESYGIGITKKIGREKGVNPIWYVDITLGHNWLTNPLNAMIDKEIEASTFEGSNISQISPFIEQMGSGTGTAGGYRKEFWWEREWRHVGGFNLPQKYIIFCPSSEKAKFAKLLKDNELNSQAFIDPNWNLEQIVANLAGFQSQDVDLW